jgi:hypothetical protein
MGLKLTNNATSTLAAGITDAATSLTVQSGDAGLFPSLGAGDWFPLTLVDGNGNMEIVLATARAGAVITVTRAQEGTTALAFPAGSRVDLRATGAALLGTTQASLAGAVEKSPPVDADSVALIDSAANQGLKRLTWANLKTALQSFLEGVFDLRYFSAGDGAALAVTVSGKADNVHAHDISQVTGLQPALDGKLATSGTATNANALGGVAAANFCRSDTSDTINGSLTVTGNFTVHGNAYVGKNGGGDSWTYYYDDNSNQWRSLGWDDSLNCFVAEENDGGHHPLALVETSSSHSLTSLPIGHTIMANVGSLPNRNASRAIHLFTGNNAQYVDSTYPSGKGSTLTGTYRARGAATGEVFQFTRVL